MKKANYIVAIDLDGVLADFAGRVFDITGEYPDDIDDELMWRRIGSYNKRIEPFYENLDVLSDAYDLVSFVESHFTDYFILSAAGDWKAYHEQKIRWVKKVLGPYTKTIIVVDSSDKALYARPDRILIDDRTVSTDPWRNAGGIAVLHKNTANTINKLRTIMEQES